MWAGCVARSRACTWQPHGLTHIASLHVHREASSAARTGLAVVSKPLPEFPLLTLPSIGRNGSWWDIEMLMCQLARNVRRPGGQAGRWPHTVVAVSFSMTGVRTARSQSATGSMSFFDSGRGIFI